VYICLLRLFSVTASTIVSRCCERSVMNSRKAVASDVDVSTDLLFVSCCCCCSCTRCSLPVDSLAPRNTPLVRPSVRPSVHPSVHQFWSFQFPTATSVHLSVRTFSPLSIVYLLPSNCCTGVRYNHHSHYVRVGYSQSLSGPFVR